MPGVSTEPKAIAMHFNATIHMNTGSLLSVCWTNLSPKTILEVLLSAMHGKMVLPTSSEQVQDEICLRSQHEQRYVQNRLSTEISS